MRANWQKKVVIFYIVVMCIIGIASVIEAVKRKGDPYELYAVAGFCFGSAILVGILQYRSDRKKRQRKQYGIRDKRSRR